MKTFISMLLCGLLVSPVAAYDDLTFEQAKKYFLRDCESLYPSRLLFKLDENGIVKDENGDAVLTKTGEAYKRCQANHLKGQGFLLHSCEGLSILIPSAIAEADRTGFTAKVEFLFKFAEEKGCPLE